MAGISEEQDQAIVISWSLYYDCLKWLHHIPNGAFLGGRTPAQRATVARKLKKQGLKTGVSDLFLPVARKGYHGLYIEMKNRQGTGRLSDDQKDFINDMASENYLCHVCEGSDEAIAQIKHYMELK